MIAIDGATNQKIARIPMGSGYTLALCWNPTNNKVYSANYYSDNITVIDGATNAVITSIPVGGGPYALAYNPTNNKVYCAKWYHNAVTVIDGEDNSVITTVPVGEGPRALVYNPTNNKVYCANYYGNVTVIDGATNSVITTIPVGLSTCQLVYNPTNNKVYCTIALGENVYNVTVIDGETNSVITTIPVFVPIALVYNPTNNKVYCASFRNIPPYDSPVTVIDGATDAVITTIIPAPGTYACALVYNPTNNKVYCGIWGGNVIVIDGEADTVITTVTTVTYPRGLVYNPTNNKVYCANYSDNWSSDVTVIDGATDTVITTIKVGYGPCALVYNPTNNKIYGANAGGDNVTVIDGATNSVITNIPAGDEPRALVYNPTNNKVYCANYNSGDVTVIDGEYNSVITSIPEFQIGYRPCALVYNPTNNKIYCANYNSSSNVTVITVIDGVTNSVITNIPAGTGGEPQPHAFVYNPTNNKVYCAGGDNVTVIDGATNAVITTVPVGVGGALVYNPTNNKVYCAFEGGDVTVIDGATNTVITTVPTGGEPYALVYNPTNNKVYCANLGSNNVTVIDGEDNSVITTITVGDEPRALVYNPTNNKVYCANAGLGYDNPDSTVTVIDGTTNAVITTITVGRQPMAFTYNPLQNRSYVANFYGPSISVIRDVMVTDTIPYEIVLGPGTSSWEIDGVGDPFILKENGTYKMWYRGNHYWGYPGWWPNDASIGYAESDDGVNYVNRQQVHTIGTGTDFLRTWAPWIIKEGSTYRMWHSDYYIWVGGDWSSYISHITSADGINWGNEQTVLTGSGDLSDYDDYCTDNPSVVREADGTYSMYYHVSQRPAVGVSGHFNIVRATSADGINWSNKQLVLPRIPGGPEEQVVAPDVVREADGTYTMYYVGVDTIGAIYRAKSTDGITWINRQRILEAAQLSSDITGVGNPHHFRDSDGTEYLYFSFERPVEGSTTGYCEYIGRVLLSAINPQISVNVSSGWNMISVPLIVENGRKDFLFPTSVSRAFTYVDSYVAKETLSTGVGYWLKFSSTQTILLFGTKLIAKTVNVKEGWNMIGSISEPVPKSSITSDPPEMITSNFFGYSGSYEIIDTIYPGKGYWVKVNQNGKLFLSVNPGGALSKRIKIIPTSELPPSPPSESGEFMTLPKEYALEQNYPNPFNPTTILKYQLPVESKVRLRIYNIFGQEVITIVDAIQDAGFKQIEWNVGRSGVASGVYFYRLEATSVSDPSKSCTQVRKMILIK
ncbi:MAG: beta-propeller fold lactonase family protein [Bacteroidota bacterium]|nr:beta-propeller fold lactonase family protein [Bacteroidota bacterium]